MEGHSGKEGVWGEGSQGKLRGEFLRKERCWEKETLKGKKFWRKVDSWGESSKMKRILGEDSRRQVLGGRTLNSETGNPA